MALKECNKYVFAIRSPYSYLNALELRNSLSLTAEECYLVIGFKNYNDIDIQQFKGLCNEQDWVRVSYVPINMDAYLLYNKFGESGSFGVLDKSREMKKFVQSVGEVLPSADDVYGVVVQNIEDYLFLHVGNYLDPNVIYCLDEGARTICTALERSGNDSNSGSQKFGQYVKRNIMELLYGYKVSPISSIHYFTCYNVPLRKNDAILVNTYELLRKKIRDIPKDGNTLLFIGSSLSEVGVVSEEYYLYCLKEISRYYYGKKICYVAHRGDCEEKLRKIEKDLGMTVVKYNIPFELVISQGESIPYGVVSFYSSVLVNCYKMFADNLKVVSVRLDYNELSNRHKDDIINVYNYFEELAGGDFNLLEMKDICQ
jgi:hypothetical protein